MDIKNKATSINLFSFSTRPMRAFHVTWFAFFLCFFAWFGIAPLMAVVREELGLTKQQIGNTIIASVAITIIARLIIGWLCDKIGPRLSYTWLLILGSLPVMGIGFAHDYESFLLFRLAIGAIGASFVITQYHTSVMFAPNCVGTANATSAGWGNLGGGVTQMIMPLIFAGFVGLGYANYWSWRLSMVVAGGVCFLTGIAYFFLTTDYPNGNRKELIASGEIPEVVHKQKGLFWLAAKDYRVWALFLIYAACFGIELTINNIAALYFKDYFGLGLKTAGLVAGLFGLMNIFARTLGGVIGDKFGQAGGLHGRVKWLFIALLVEGIALLLFSRMTILPMAIGTMIVFSLFVQMSEGATYSVVPFINKKAIGSVSGIVGAGGNMGAVTAGFLFRAENISWPQGLFILGIMVILFAFAAFFVRFSAAEEEAAKIEFDKAVEERKSLAAGKESWIPIPDFSRVGPMDLLRVYLGVALAIKGIYFIINMKAMEALTAGIGMMEEATAWFVVFAHTVGGVALALGFATRVASAINAVVLFGAILFVHAQEGLFAANQGFEFSLFVLFALLLLFWRGSGKFSVDHYLFNGESSKASA
ncbi:MAG: NarK family nitrate/nitrite MFS transporter [Bdellovibrionaceae bacterium]|nr:NarK family nitrate/nitrite MFS transporter [Bdellovibrionales bacterium]MCB9083459.1 NarK family nitrate/nitrite MFS transporter [Pseudobdellovibrionaceae bacterium]